MIIIINLCILIRYFKRSLMPTKIIAYLTLILLPSSFVPSLLLAEELIINQKSSNSDSVQLIGGKAASLHHLQQVPNIRIPKWFCLTTTMFKHYLELNHIDEEIKKLDTLSQEWVLASPEDRKILEKMVYNQANIIRNSILDAKINEEFRSAINVEYKNLMDTPVAVRSSGIIEDLPDSSFAGIYDTFLNQKNLESVISSVKECWASVFNDRAVFERNSRNIKHCDALTGVIVQQMVDAKIAGTAFNMEIGTGYDGIEIAANYGLGESVVGGEVSVDKWLVHPKTNRIIKSVLGNKKFKVISDPNKSGIEVIPSMDIEKNIFVLNTGMVQEVSAKVKEIAQYYLHAFSYAHIDTEFAFDHENNLYFLQARPLVTVATAEFNVLDKEDAKTHRILAKGRYSVPGVASGKVKYIPAWQDLADGRIVIEPDDIVVTNVSTNYWSQYMTNFKGMITLEGGPTSHPILLCRERKVPCVIALEKEPFEKLKELDGQYVTIDGINQNIYEGKIKFKASTPEDFSSLFEIPVEEPFQLVHELQLFDKCIPEMRNGEEILWHTKPSHPLDKILQGINLIALSKNAALLGLEPGAHEAKIIDNYAAEKYRSAEQKFHEFSKMDLKATENFLIKEEEACNQYLELCKDFTLTVENWKKYIDLTSEVRSYVISGFNFRDYVSRMAIREAQRLEIPKHYLEAYSEQLQSQIVEDDTLVVRDLQALARKVKTSSLITLKEETPDIYLELEKLAKHYRFQKNASFTHDLDLEIVFRRVLQEIENLGASENRAEKTNAINEYYFPHDDALRRWMYLGVKSRISQTDCNHRLARGQWAVREALLELGEELTAQGQLNHPKEIFDLSLDEITVVLNKKINYDS